MPFPLFPLQSSSPLLSHNFIVLLDAIMPVSFSKIRSIEISAETEVLVEGGQNNFVHSLSKPQAAEKILVMERGVEGVSLSLSDFSLLGWATDKALSVGMVFGQLIICVLDHAGIPKKVYAVKHAVLKKRRFSDLDAMSGEVFVESLEFAYREMTEVPDMAARIFGLLS